MACKVDGCQGEAKQAGMCYRHYQRLRRFGSTDAPNRARRSHCKRGHPFTDDNSYVSPHGKRMCRACLNRRAMERRQREMDAERASWEMLND